MYVTIKSRNEQNLRSARSMWVNTEIEKLELVQASPSHLGSPPWYLRFKGDTHEERGTGERGGEMVVIDRDLEVQLTPQDLMLLFNFALEHNLLAVTTLTGREDR